MNFELKNFVPSNVSIEKCDVSLVLVTNTFQAGKDALSVLIAKAIKSGDLKAKAGQILDIYRPLGFCATHVVLVQVADGTPADMRKGLSAAMVLVKAFKARQMTVSFLQQPTAQGLRVAITTLADASYVYTTTKSDQEGHSLEAVAIAVPDEQALGAIFARAVAAVNGIELAKEWSNRPANYATPTHLAGVAKALAKFSRIKVEVLGHKDVVKLGMGAFLAVAKGSDEPLRFIVLHYHGAAKSDAPVVLVGKGITFDSGGISIKPAAEMDEMKYDMCGAASVLGVFRALAELQPDINVVGLIASCENLPSNCALKPGDVVTSMSGQTIEVLNTDAEGRLVLCDALTYAERFKPKAVLDIATLTGACVVALGGVRSGFFTDDAGVSAALLAAGESSQDLCWQMPLDEDYAEGLKTSFADVANVAGRAGGAVTAAKFLQRFTGKYRWAHLDIAGTAWKSGAAKGATGRPVGLLLDYLLDHDPAGPSA
ncbi:MAG: leucyl aminopeptidase [Rhodoferax sp.]|uniref:leucyl aminopeptidase n=1 Tax=Rhodoferax sp. TaxID=50421 RepID=UPI00262A45E3|nr:leucyl aminopeptidase [Rhodoferax sp.]MDD2882738.1 leucyl aminopeptidase [Rhodoferax sp.]